MNFQSNLKSCPHCGELKIVSDLLRICRDCLINQFPAVRPLLEEVHRKTRTEFSLPIKFQEREGDLRCVLCLRRCSLEDKETGFCGLVKREGRQILNPGTKIGYYTWYYDPLPTNCVADWICPGGTGCGYPKFAYRPGPEYGYYNLAIFFESCNLNCLYCQNWHFRSNSGKRAREPEELLLALRDEVACLCYFGGDPSTQTPFAIKVSEEALRRRKGKICRLCWETNGLFSPKLLPKIIELSLVSGGIIKFDLKAWSPEIHYALTGFYPEGIRENFKFVASFITERKEVPLLTASTLLVPGYVEEEEVLKIATFIAEINPEIPYRILAFAPQFYLRDLPLISKKKAYRALEAAKGVGLRRVSLGNEHLLQ